ncbi:PorV/PorQ family protein [candidate division KSB1 bacterium]|nr:PorV/PorQ family protein [candidate division KSB1 bacterium]
MRAVAIFIIVLSVINAPVAFTQAENGLAALQIGVGARATAMGEAFTAAADDATSAFWNPAGNAWLQKRQAHFTHTAWFQDVQQNTASVVFPVKGYALGLHVLLNSVSGIEQRLYATEEPLHTFSAHDFVFGIGLAKRFGDRVAAGANVRYVNEKIYVESADGFSVDAGLQVRTPLQGLIAGMSVQHFGATAKLKKEKIRLPKTLRLGTAYQLPAFLIPFPWIVAADYVYVFDDEAAVHLGSEINPWPLLSLRLGYLTGWDTHNISAGFGLKLNVFCLDYAYVPFKHDLGNAHRFSFLVAF